MTDILIFALITLYLFYKLYYSLGDTSHNNPDAPTKKKEMSGFAAQFAKQADLNTKKELVQHIDMVSALEAELPESFRTIFDNIRTGDQSFTADKFIEKAKLAYEYILKAFADKNKDALKTMLDLDLCQAFEDSIDEYNSNEEALSTEIIGFKKVKIESVKTLHNDVYITLAMDVEQISFVKNMSDNAIKNGSTSIKLEHETWTFVKSLNKNDKVWKLISTDAEFVNEIK